MTPPDRPASPRPAETPAPSATEPGAVPERFIVSRGVLRLDRFMTQGIQIGGISIILAVFGIFFFIASVIWPLFQRPSLTPLRQLALEASASTLVGLDDRGSQAFAYDGGDSVRFLNLLTPDAPAQTARVPLPAGVAITHHALDRHGDRILLGTADGQAAFLDLRFPSAGAAGATLSPWVRLAPAATAAGEPTPTRVTALDYAGQGERKLFGALLASPDNAPPRLVVVGQRQKKGLLGGGKLEATAPEDLTPLLEGAHATRLLLPGTADSLVVLTRDNTLWYLFQTPGGWQVRQRFQPFADSGTEVTALNFLYGDVTLVVGDATGAVRLFSLHVPEGSERRIFAETQRLQPLQQAVLLCTTSRRNKSFVVGGETQSALCYGTTGSIRATLDHAAPLSALCLDSRTEHLAALDTQGQLHLHALHDPHPEAGWRSFFGQLWYEGYNQPRWEWQSTGGTDDFEPKLSLVPLIIGSIKGTVYAMLFAVPVALLAAIYASQFLSPATKRVVKPAMEIMASLPSVVLGFLAALWLAPLIETKVPSVLLLLLSIPLAAILAGLAWVRVPLHRRNALPRGSEFWLLAPLMLGLGWLAWAAGPALERALFVATLPDGTQIADFRLWWPQFSGLPFDQRNCIVVGFIMGFAVIPVIFTIAEDALSNVPPALTSAAEALGASRWQVVRTIVLPVASAGIFSALMIGLGRAVGETMIVVMATGNTPVVDEAGRLLLGDFGLGGGSFPLADHWNPFSGMRTLSANIAVELPEAALGSTHYRTLFLGAFVLFLLTFILNTAAELLRQRLRERFKIV